MKKILLSVLLLGVMTAQVQTVTMPNGTSRPLSDINGDGEVNTILGKTPPPVPALSCPDDHHPHMIDLGLPSGTKWACCNVGASSPEGYGGYYAWGETQTKRVYSWGTYKWGRGSDYRAYNKVTKYNTKSDYGSVVDNNTILDPADDAATANWGASWCMPSWTQVKELLNKCSSQWTQQNGVNGRLFTGPNGKRVFLPAAGHCTGGELSRGGGYYWSSSLDDDDPDFAYYLHFYSNEANRHGSLRDCGLTVRPVHKPEPVPVLSCPDGHHPHLIDLGLPSGTKWACCNVGASSPEEYGGYYAWGETQTKSVYNGEMYKSGSTSSNMVYMGSSIAGTKNDVATANWGASWCMPSLNQLKELFNKCSSQWTQQNGVNGRLFTGPNGKRVFLPAAGYRRSDRSGGEGSDGYYWSSSFSEGAPIHVSELRFYSGDAIWSSTSIIYGYTVRPVHKNVNGDGEVKTILGKTPEPKPEPVPVLSCPDDHHPHLIDLGLPSGTKWACCNVGASSPEASGDYYAWGETQTKSVYNWDTYQYGSSSSNVVNIGSNIAGTKYDAVTANWGASWCMPSWIQVKELISKCSSQWTQQNGVNGRLFTGPNGKRVFLPAAGYRSNGELRIKGSDGSYWSSSLGESDPGRAYSLGVASGYAGWGNDDRNNGLTVRPVHKNVNGDGEVKAILGKTQEPKPEPVPVRKNVNGDGKVNTILGKTPEPKPEPVPVLSCPDDHHPHMIDLGLPSGTKWACCNVGASSPEGYGSYYACGETSDYHVGRPYKWGSGYKKLTKYNTKSFYGSVVDNKTTLEPADDAATANWGAPWRMPTEKDFQELMNNTTFTEATKNGVEGTEFKGANGGTIFLPAAGDRWDDGLYGGGSLDHTPMGYYWSSSINEILPYKACSFTCGLGYMRLSRDFDRNRGHTVRPVRKN